MEKAPGNPNYQYQPFPKMVYKEELYKIVANEDELAEAREAGYQTNDAHRKAPKAKDTPKPETTPTDPGATTAKTFKAPPRPKAVGPIDL